MLTRRAPLVLDLCFLRFYKWLSLWNMWQPDHRPRRSLGQHQLLIHEEGQFLSRCSPNAGLGLTCSAFSPVQCQSVYGTKSSRHKLCSSTPFSTVNWSPGWEVAEGSGPVVFIFLFNCILVRFCFVWTGLYSFMFLFLFFYIYLYMKVCA